MENPRAPLRSMLAEMVGKFDEGLATRFPRIPSVPPPPDTLPPVMVRLSIVSENPFSLNLPQRFQNHAASQHL